MQLYQNLVTDASGEVHQHMEYFPFGERRSPRERLLNKSNGEQTFYEEAHGNDKNTPYKFNGKELDEETGLYYYGARYYDPRISMWYGVDPMAEKYYFESPYCYVGNNPLLFIDPDGEAKWRIGITLKSSIGKKNVEAKVGGIPVGYSNSKEAIETSREFYFEFDTETAEFRLGTESSTKEINKEETLSLGIFSHSESETREKVDDVNSIDGDDSPNDKKEKTFKNEEKSAVGPISIEETDGEKNLKIEVTYGLEVFGLGFEYGIKASDEKYLNEKK